MITFDFGLAHWLAIGLGLVLIAIGAGYPLLRGLLRRVRPTGSAPPEQAAGEDSPFRRPGT